MSTSIRRLRWTLLALPVFLIAFVACETTPDPTPVPTATATPIPLPLPILVNLDDDPLAVFQLIPEEEQQCLAQSLGQARLDELLSDAEFTEEDGRVAAQCISQETIVRIMLGFVIDQTDGLRDDTLICAWDILGEVDLKLLFTSDDDESRILAVQTIIDASFCLSDEEVARAAAAAGIEDFPVDGLRCLAGRVNVESLVNMFSADHADHAAPSEEIMVAMLECGIEGFGTKEGFPQLTPEQLACLEAASETESLAEFFSQGSELQLEAIAAILECGIEGDSGGVDGGLSVNISAEDIACVVETLGEEALTEIMAGERLPTFGEIMALVGCDLDLESLLNDS